MSFFWYIIRGSNDNGEGRKHLKTGGLTALPELTYPGNYPNSMSLFIVSPFSFPFVLKKEVDCYIYLGYYKEKISIIIFFRILKLGITNLFVT